MMCLQRKGTGTPPPGKKKKKKPFGEGLGNTIQIKILRIE